MEKEFGNTEDKGERKETGIDIWKALETQNVAELVDDRELDEIGGMCHEEYLNDKGSRATWEREMKEAMDLAMQERTPKNDPWNNAANVKYPLLTISAIQFAARVYPMIVSGRNVVKGVVVGADPQGEKAAAARRVASHMNYQLLDEMEGWEEEMDQLLHMLPVVGTVIKKTYRDPVTGKNVSELISPEDFVVSYYTKSLTDDTRCTHVYTLSRNKVVERIRNGTFLDCDLGEPDAEEGDVDSDTPYKFLEQHRLLDLDEDGYGEPYIVTIHERSHKIVRIEPRFGIGDIDVNDDGEIQHIKADNFFTKIPFIPSPDGSFYDVGFGKLLTPLNSTVNTIINQLIDAGTLSNSQGGFIGKGVKLRGGSMRFKPGEWKMVDSRGTDMRQNIVPLPVRDPSNVLFQMLGMLVSSGERLSSITQPMAGENLGTHVTASTTAALINQGMKVFSGISKRIHASLKEELKKLYRLNSLYMNDAEYFNVIDENPAPAGAIQGEVAEQPQGDAVVEQGSVMNSDYSLDTADVLPYSDPTSVNDTEKMMKMQSLVEIGRGNPDVNQRALTEYAFEALGIPDGAKRFMSPPQQGPSPEALVEMTKLEHEDTKLKIRLFEMEAKVLELKSRTMKHLTDVEIETPDMEYGNAIDKYGALKGEMEKDAARIIGGGSGPVEGIPGNQGAVQPNQGGVGPSEGGPA